MFIQFLIRFKCLAIRSLQPSVVTALRYIEFFAHLLDSEKNTVLFNKRIFHLRGFKKMATDFFKISLSSVTSANCFSKRSTFS